MRHAGEDSLDELGRFLDELRSLAGLVERKRGVFYRRSRAFLHFHEDPTGLYADVRLDDGFERVPVQTRLQQDDLLRRIRAVVRDT
jgi:hypothetical protein